MSDAIASLRAAIDGAVAELRGDESAGAAPSLERPPNPELGDYSTNGAMLLAPVLGDAPRAIAEKLRDGVATTLGPALEKVEVAGPGFLNLYVSDRWCRDAVRGILAAGDAFGPALADQPLRINVEFVSANPTGPLTAAGGRHAAYGDSVARVLEAVGHEVEREYYLNDSGGQIRNFAASIAARMTGAAVPEDGYAGDYVTELAEALAAEGVGPDELDRLAVSGSERMRESIAATLERYGVEFSHWASERELHEAGAVEAVVEQLRERGHVYESDGALWLRTSDFGDDKDRVLVRTDGEPTYFVGDIAYHRDKIERGAQRMINVLGADHHGYVPRLRAAIAALGHDPESFEAPIMQLVNLIEGGTRAQMSKRKGEFATLDELIDDVGTDAARFLMLQRSQDTELDLDLDLARAQSSEDPRSSENPVFYVQYAHARICSILRKAGVEDFDPTAAALDVPVAASERRVVKRLLEFPAEITAAANRLAPHRLTAYAMGIAADFNAFYGECKVVGEAPDVEAARLEVCLASRRVIARTLKLIGVSAPEEM